MTNLFEICKALARVLSEAARVSTCLFLASTCYAGSGEVASDDGVIRSVIYSTVSDGSKRRCIDVAGAGLYWDTNIQQWECNNTEAQLFKFYPVYPNRNVYQIVNENSGICMDVANGSWDNGTNIRQWGCNGTKSQQFKIVQLRDYRRIIVSEANGKCLDINNFHPHWESTYGANVQLWQCYFNSNQTFILPGVPQH